MDPDSSATDDDIRGDDGRFLPGRTGNPLGRPVGSRRVLGLARALVEAGIVAVVLTERPGMVRSAATALRPRRPAT